MKVDGSNVPAVWTDPEDPIGEPFFVVEQDGSIGLLEFSAVKEWVRAYHNNCADYIGQRVQVQLPGGVLKPCILEVTGDQEGVTLTISEMSGAILHSFKI
jgi:hypothetical protein